MTEIIIDIKEMSSKNLETIRLVVGTLHKELSEKAIWNDAIIKVLLTDEYQEKVILEIENKELSKNIRKKSIVIEKQEGIVVVIDYRNYKWRNELIQIIIKINASFTCKQIKLSEENAPGYFSIKNSLAYLFKYWINQYIQLEVAIKNGYENSFAPTVRLDYIIHLFKKNLKADLYIYNGDYDVHKVRLTDFYVAINQGFHKLISSILPYHVLLENQISQILNKKEAENIINFLDEITLFKEALIKGEAVDYFSLETKFITFYKYYSITLIQHEKNIEIILTKNPKEYFKGELVETDPRIVCFMDIMGFKELIKEYSSNSMSTLLLDIKAAFDNSLKTIQNYKEIHKELLEFKMFSDNICISYPYFSNQEDFLNSLDIVCMIARRMQMSMLLNGYYLRGGISIGQYYSNKNLIFSEGLVKAYKIETEIAKFPRVVIDSEILSELGKMDVELIKSKAISNYLVTDWEETVFISPIYFLEELHSQLKEINDLGENAVSNLSPQTELSRLLKTIFPTYTEAFDPKLEWESSFVSIQMKLRVEIANKYDNSKVVSQLRWLDEYMKWLAGKEESKLVFSNYVSSLSSVN